MLLLELRQKQVFSKYFRSEDIDIRARPGTGLGLYITKSLIEMQNGRIWFESKYGQGTAFHFTLPVAPDDVDSHALEETVENQLSPELSSPEKNGWFSPDAFSLNSTSLSST